MIEESPQFEVHTDLLVRRTMRGNQSRHRGLPPRFKTQGTSHGDRFHRRNAPTDGENIIDGGLSLNQVSNGHMTQPTMGGLENEIERMFHALALVSHDHPDLSAQPGSLEVSHTPRDLFGPLVRQGDLENLTKTISRALAFAPETHPNQPKWLSDLGVFYGDRFKRLNELDDLEKAIEHMSRALKLTLDDDPDQPTRVSDLGEFHGYRFRRLGELGDLEKAMDHTRRALTLTPDGHPDQSKRLSNLGMLHNDRFQRLGELEDNGQAIECGSLAVALTPDGHPDLPKWLSSLAVSHGNRFKRLNELEDLEKAIELMSCAHTLVPEDDPDEPTRFNSLGELHGYRFRRLGDLADLEKAMGHMCHALALTPDGHPELPRRLSDLGTVYGDRFRRLGEIYDNDRAIEYSSRAITLTPSGHPDLPKWLSTLGISYGDRFKRLNELGDLENAIDCMSRAHARAPNDDPDQPKRLGDLGEFHGYRFRRLGDLADLNKAMDYTRRAVGLTPGDHPELPCRLNNLGALHGDRFRRVGELTDSEEAIEHSSGALALAPNGHPDLPKYHSSLGISYSDRFKRLNELGDLENAIKSMSLALDLTPDNHPDMPHRFSNLAATYRDRFQHLGELYDNERAIEFASRALALTPDDHPDLPNRFHDLGELYGDLSRQLDELENLEKAIEYMSRAVESTPNDHPDLPKWLNSLGESHGDRFQHSNELTDLERAISYARRALVLTPEGHPSLPTKHALLARLRFFQHGVTGSDLYLQDTLNSFRMASKSSAGAPGTKFRIALDWVSLASDSDSLECIEAYQTAMDLLPQYIWLGATTNQRYQDLSTAANFAVDAASVATLSLNYALALEWLEHARCVVWNQILRLRSPLDELGSAHPDLATRLRDIAKRLNDASSESRESRASSSGLMTPEEIGREHRRLAMEYDRLLSQARALPGFENFLRPIKAGSLVQAAQHGPIVVINCHAGGCDAFIILPGQNNINHIFLPNFTEENARHARNEIEVSLRSKGIRGIRAQRPMDEDKFEGVLKTLWYEIVKPVLELLGYMSASKVEPPDNPGDGGTREHSSLPHIIWCLTGAATFLPIHAAGDYTQPGPRVFDYVVSSYTPTLTALFASSPSSLNCDTKVLAIGQPNTPGHSPLPGVIKELGYVKAHIQDKAQYSQLIDDQATTAVVLDAMEQHDWVHLACHAHQNVSEPSRSGFFLHDDTLGLASINRQAFNKKGLAYLAACQTAAGDEKLPDEVIHLASGMLMAGYTSVIATMWSIVDQDVPFVTDKVYAQLMEDGKLGNGEAGRALHYAVAELRSKVGEMEFGRWAPYIHLGS
ncbi:unnamed protein product [Rhizoctonia solani]|uniref:CHAT domain-containing protein n=1 Tax=Rhizoctonia solani TaxID=456999 RepID=A0A8H3DQN5_9AGAM|nr:unnamed protein product [Rhizoctonia solani]